MQVRMCRTTHKLRMIATLSDLSLSSYSLLPMALHQYSHILLAMLFYRHLILHLQIRLLPLSLIRGGSPIRIYRKRGYQLVPSHHSVWNFHCEPTNLNDPLSISQAIWWAISCATFAEYAFLPYPVLRLVIAKRKSKCFGSFLTVTWGAVLKVIETLLRD